MTYEQEQRLIQAAEKDAFYQELLSRCGELEQEYSRIKSSLPVRDQEKLEWYISACEELDHRRMLLAYALGTQEGVKSGCAEFGKD